jgi:hypothetical protein
MLCTPALVFTDKTHSLSQCYTPLMSQSQTSLEQIFETQIQNYRVILPSLFLLYTLYTRSP